jgi:hypothetical protein
MTVLVQFMKGIESERAGIGIFIMSSTIRAGYIHLSLVRINVNPDFISKGGRLKDKNEIKIN